MKHTMSDIRNICEHLTFYAETLYKARLKDGVCYIFKEKELLFQTNILKEARQFLIDLQAKIKGLC